MWTQLKKLLQTQKTKPPPSRSPQPAPRIPAEDTACPPGQRSNPGRPPGKNYYQEPRRIKGKQVRDRGSYLEPCQARGGTESLTSRLPWDPGDERKASIRSDIRWLEEVVLTSSSTLSLHETDSTFQTMSRPKETTRQARHSPARSPKKSKSLPSLSPKTRAVDYSAAEARKVDYSYLDKFKPPPVQYQTSR